MNTTQIISTVIAFVITSIIVYFFKQRQLYLALTGLYSNSTISEKSSIFQLTIYNQGNSVEEDIKIELNPNIPISLLSSDNSMLKYENNTISINLLHKKSRTSCMLLVENDNSLALTDIQSFYSKNIKGSSFKSNDANNVPPNAGNVAIVFGTIIFFLVCLFNLDSAIQFVQDKYSHSKYSYLYSIGWSNLDRYSGSDLEKKSYTQNEFPVKFISRQLDENDSTIVTYVFEVYNKTTNDLEVRVENPNYSSGQWEKDLDEYGKKPRIEKIILTPEQQKEEEEDNIKIKSYEKEIKKAKKVIDNPKQYTKESFEKAQLAYQLYQNKISLTHLFAIPRKTSSVSRASFPLFPVSCFLDVKVAPLTKAELKFTTKLLPNNENLEFDMTWMKERIFNIKYTISNK